MDGLRRAQHKEDMPRRQYSPTQIREWRNYRDLTLEQLGSRIGMTAGNLSRLERGLVPYSQEILEAVADSLRCEPADLLQPPADPAREEWNRLLNKLTQDKSAKALRLIKTFLDDSEVA